MATSRKILDYLQATRQPDRATAEHAFKEIIGESFTLRRVLEQIELVAPTDSTVLIEGETGTGKELIARAIHNLSPRKHESFVKINCAAIPLELMESEFFGHEKGAFTGAIGQRIGRFELANKGTIFLDEIGDLPPAIQPKLLRVLQEREFERVGSSRTIEVDVRVIVATNRDLAQMVDEKKYRSDLYYRLNVFPITVPPLRDRGDDIRVLAQHFANMYALRLNKRIEMIPEEAMDALTGYYWPGNVRELQNIVERAVILSRDGMLRPSLPEVKKTSKLSLTSTVTLEEIEHDYILQALLDTNWVVGGQNGAAARLGLKRTTLISKMERLGISRQI